jgi:hypothetical protein
LFFPEEPLMKKFPFVRQAGFLSASCCWLVVLVVGCSRETNLGVGDLGELKGTVTHNSRPVVHGAVHFYSDKGLTCVAVIEKDGTYRTPLIPGEFKVAIVTMIEPREAARLAKEGPPDLVGAPGGRIPERIPIDGKVVVKDADVEYERLPTLRSLLEKLPPADRSTLEAVQKRYSKPAESGLTVTVKKGPSTHHFDLR